MSSFEDQFMGDASLEAEGAWVDMAAGCKFKIAAAGPSNPAFVKAAERLTRQYRQQFANNTLTNEQATALQARIYAETILLDWTGLVLGGKEVPYSTAAAEKLLLDSWRVRQRVEQIAGDVATFQKRKLEDEAKN